MGNKCFRNQEDCRASYKRKSNILFLQAQEVFMVKKENKVTEDLSCVPISVYNKTKMISEKVLHSYSDKIKFIVLDLQLYVVFHPE